MNQMPSVYFEESYLKVWVAYDGATPLQLHIGSGNAEFLLNLLVRPIPGSDGLLEAYTPYGYGGPVLLSGGGDVTLPLRDMIDRLRESNVVCAFVRFAPFLGNSRLFPPGLVSLNRYTLSRRLHVSAGDDLAGEFGKGTRWAIRKSVESGVVVTMKPGSQVTTEESREFLQLYQENMRRVSASHYLFLSESCLENHFRYLGNRVALFTARQGSELIGAALFLVDESRVHYHLSASRHEHNGTFPIERILYEAIKYYGNEGLSELHLGGGLSLSADDPLYRFKLKFARPADPRPFYISKLVIDEQAYQQARGRLDIMESPLFLIGDALAARRDA